MPTTPPQTLAPALPVVRDSSWPPCKRKKYTDVFEDIIQGGVDGWMGQDGRYDADEPPLLRGHSFVELG